MQQSRRIWLVGLGVLLLAAVPAARAQQDDNSRQLEQALALFDRQEYVAAEEALQEVERASLTEALQEEYDLLKRLLAQAVLENEDARVRLAEANEAFTEGAWDRADQLYGVVLEMKYAKADLKTQARERRAEIARRRELAQAAEPNGVLPNQPAQPPAAAEPAAPAEEAPFIAPPPPGAERVAPPPPATPMAPAPRTAVDVLRERDELLWQRAVAQANDLAAQARQAVAEQRFTDAQQYAGLALQKIEAARNYAEPVSRYIAARESASRLIEEVRQAYTDFQTRQAAIEQQEIIERMEARRELLERQRREKIEQLFNTAAQLRKEQRFEEAAEILRQILAIDAGNIKAQAQLEIAEDYASLMKQKQWERDLNFQTRSSLVSAQEALIPWDVEVLYPRNWLELSARREASAIGTGEFEGDSELNRKLSEVLPEFNFQDAPLEQVMEHLQELQEINIHVDWEDLEFNGIERDKPVTIQLRNLPFSTVLKEILSQAGGDIRLGYSVSEGLLRIATKDKLDRDKVVLVYDIRDLLVNVPRFNNAATLDPAQALQQQGQAGGGGGAGAQLFQSTQQNQQREDEQDGDLVERLMEIIRQTVEPDSWVETGGGDASLRELNGQLIIYNTSDAHGQIRGLLDQLRATRALQIAVETRFLNVVSNFLEEFGVDLDFVFNSGSAGFDRTFSAGGVPLVDPFTGANVLMPRQYSRIGATPSTPGFGNAMPQATVGQPYSQAGFVPYGTGVSPHFSEMTPITAQQGSIALADPANLTTGVPGSFAQRVAAPALNIAGSFLDNLQVDFLIRATQANQRSSIVQAPRLVLFNGQRANISIGRSRTYVSSVQPQVAEGAIGVQPITNQAPSGTVLVVDGTISADRRYVTITVETTQTDEPTFERFEVQRASGNSPGIFILLPDQGFVTVNTTVSIPDGGTVLLGGLKQVGEVEVEAGVPILSKIPILKRAFTNRTMIKDTRTLLILMKSKIIIQKEAEAEAFPTFTALGG